MSITELFNLLVPDVIRGVNDAITVARLGAGTKITWQAGQNWTGGDVETLLRRYGIRVYARQYANNDEGEYAVTVTDKQARHAEYRCRRAGVPLTGPLIDESNRNVMPGEMGASWSDNGAKPVGAADVYGLLLGTPQRNSRQERQAQRRRRRGTR
jgi:hypothetical protein